MLLELVGLHKHWKQEEGRRKRQKSVRSRLEISLLENIFFRCLAKVLVSAHTVYQSQF